MRQPVRKQNAISISELRHATETSRFIFAVFAIALLLLNAGVYIVIFPPFLLILLSAAISVWLAINILQAVVVGNSIRVTQKSFPRLQRLIDKAKIRLGYDHEVWVYVGRQGLLEGALYRLFKTRFIVFSPDLLDGPVTRRTYNEIYFTIARFIGALKTKHLRFQPLIFVLDRIEDLRLFNLFFLPYERARQYSGDQIGLAACRDLSAAVRALFHTLVSRDLYAGIDRAELLEVSLRSHGGAFDRLSTIAAVSPHVTSRYLNLMVFTKKCYPEVFDRYLNTLNAQEGCRINGLTPERLPRRSVVVSIVLIVLASSLSTLLLLTLLIVLTESAALAPFIYALF